jgi:hypothetical protein
MIRQHDATRADADGRRGGGDAGNQNSGGGAGDPRHVVVLRQPVTAVAQSLGMLREFNRVAKGLCGIAAFQNGREIQDGQRGHDLNLSKEPW